MSQKNASNRFYQPLMLVSVLVTSGLAAALAGCGNCGEDVISREKSPDAQYLLTGYVRNCGATTSYVTHYNISRVGERVRSTWSGTIRVGEVVSADGNEPLKIEWKDKRELVVMVESSRLIKCASSVNDIQIKCIPPNRE